LYKIYEQTPKIEESKFILCSNRIACIHSFSLFLLLVTKIVGTLQVFSISPLNKNIFPPSPT
jgi:hypothetical protein